MPSASKKSPPKLQSANEELVTVNQELFDRSEQYNHARLYAEAIVATIHEPILVLAKDFSIKIANSSFYKSFQLTEEETLGKVLFELQNNGWDIPDLRRQLLKIQVQKEKSLDWELTYNFPAVGRRIIRCNARLIQRENDDNQILLAMEDVTEREQLQFERKVLRKLQNFLQQAPVAMMVVNNKDYQLELANDKYLQLVEKDKDIIGKPLFDSIPELKEQGIKETLDEVKNSGVPVTKNEVKIKIERDKDGSSGIYNFVYQPIFKEDKSSNRILVVITEITDLMNAWREVEESELRYNNLIQSSPFSICLFHGKDMIITSANKAIINLWGKGPDVIGKPCFELLPELADQGYREIFNEVYTTGKSFNAVEIPVDFIHSGEKDTHYYNFILFAQRNINNEIDGIGFIAAEVTEAAVLHQRLKESEEQFRQTADLLPDKVFKANADGNFFYLNKAWEETTGLTQDELKNNGWLQTVHPNEIDEVKKCWVQAVESGRDCELQFRIKNKTGTYRWHLCRAMALKEDDGKIKMWIGSTTDIQEQKRREEEKSEFISIASHELKTPITTLKLYIEILQESLVTKDSQQTEKPDNNLGLVQKAAKSVNKLERLIRELLDVNIITHGKLELNITTFDFNEMLNDAIEEVQITSPDHTIIKEGDISSPFKGDRYRLQQVATNLLSNAVKYSPDSNKIFVKVTDEKELIKVSVHDRGIGIKKESLNKIFNLYFREEGKRPFQGFGIGLSIASEIVKRHNGEIWAESEPGKGTTIYFTLPK